MRNCAGQYPNSDFRYEFKKPQLDENHRIIRQCPQSFFDDVVREWYHLFDLRKLMKKTGIVEKSENITLFELNIFSIIDNEFNLIDEYEAKKDERRNQSNLSNKGR